MPLGHEARLAANSHAQAASPLHLYAFVVFFDLKEVIVSMQPSI